MPSTASGLSAAMSAARAQVVRFFLVAVAAATTDSADSTVVCKYGNGEPVAQPTTQRQLTCNPPAAAGSGMVEAKLSFSHDADYADVQVFLLSLPASGALLGAVRIKPLP